MSKGRKKNRKKTPPSSYVTLPQYYPTEQVDIVKKLKAKRKIKRR